MRPYDPMPSRGDYWAASDEPVSVRAAAAIIAGTSLGVWGLIGWALSGIL
ncbi:MAG: hypothetical protein JWL84_3299 [Rhodospirillales bacterium]|jgi:hypothetical protein|nr:hypothetical protein [Rhodospirillales bacterium]